MKWYKTVLLSAHTEFYRGTLKFWEAYKFRESLVWLKAQNNKYHNSYRFPSEKSLFHLVMPGSNPIWLVTIWRAGSFVTEASPAKFLPHLCTCHCCWSFIHLLFLPIAHFKSQRFGGDLAIWPECYFAKKKWRFWFLPSTIVVYHGSITIEMHWALLQLAYLMSGYVNTVWVFWREIWFTESEKYMLQNMKNKCAD